MEQTYNHGQTVIVTIKQGTFLGVVEIDPETQSTQKIRIDKKGKEVEMTRVLIRGAHYYVKNTKIHI